VSVTSGILANMTGTFRTYRPITADDLQTPEEQLAYVLGPALKWQLWLFFPPNSEGFGGAAMPCDDVPRRPPPEAVDTLFTVIDAVAKRSSCTQLIIGLERRGGPELNRIDREWMRVAAEASDRAGVRVRSVLLSHTRGVRHYDPLAPTLTGLVAER